MFIKNLNEEITDNNTIYGDCSICGKEIYVELTPEEYNQFVDYTEGDSLIQDLMPNTEADVREFLIGYAKGMGPMCATCQEMLFDGENSDRIKYVDEYYPEEEPTEDYMESVSQDSSFENLTEAQDGEEKTLGSWFESDYGYNDAEYRKNFVDNKRSNKNYTTRYFLPDSEISGKGAYFLFAKRSGVAFDNSNVADDKKPEEGSSLSEIASLGFPMPGADMSRDDDFGISLYSSLAEIRKNLNQWKQDGEVGFEYAVLPISVEDSYKNPKYLDNSGNPYHISSGRFSSDELDKDIKTQRMMNATDNVIMGYDKASDKYKTESIDAPTIKAVNCEEEYKEANPDSDIIVDDEEELTESHIDDYSDYDDDISDYFGEISPKYQIPERGEMLGYVELEDDFNDYDDEVGDYFSSYATSDGPTCCICGAPLPPEDFMEYNPNTNFDRLVCEKCSEKPNYEE